MNRRVEAAVIENGGLTIVSEGLAYDRCQVGIVTGIDAQARIPEFEIDTPEQMYTVLRTQVDVVLSGGAAVLDAGDPLVAKMASLCDGEVIFFDTGAGSAAVQAHLASGGRAVLVRAERIVLAEAEASRPLIELSRLALDTPAEPGAAHRLDDVLAAVGAAWALGVSPESMRAGLEVLCTVRKETFASATA